jgi:hypothetical protein
MSNVTASGTNGECATPSEPAEIRVPDAQPPGPRQVALLPAQIEVLASGLRAYLQQRTFTVEECTEVSLRLLGSFALDTGLDDRLKAASTVRRVAMRLSRAIEAGKFTVRRGR